MIIPSFLLAIASFAVAEASSVFSPRGPVKRDFVDGTPGTVCYADVYNTLGNNWNHTYTAFEPQQIHISFTDDSKSASIEFATLGQIKQSVLQYWPKKDSHLSSSKVTVKGHDWVFVDGGVAQRELYLHKLETKTLRPATIYSYQVASFTGEHDKAFEWSNTFEFHTVSKKNDFSFIATGDIGACNAVAVSHVMNLAKDHKYDFVTLAGDQAYDMADFNGTKGDEYMNFMQELYANLPYLGAVGNHELNYNFSHYKNRFDNLPYTKSKFENNLFYSINYKSLHLVSFSTESYFSGTAGEAQSAINWLEADLIKANKNRAERPWIIFLTHHPIYCSAPTSDCTTHADMIKYGFVDSNNNTYGGIEDILLKHKVDLYMSGHVHNYERTYPVAKGNRTATSYHNAPSFFQIVIGNTGQPEGAVSFGFGPFPDWSVTRYGGYGYSTFRVSPTNLDIVHYGVNTDLTDGGIIDQFSVTKDHHFHK